MVPLCDEAQVEACFGLSNIELILMQDRCTDLEIVLVWCKIGAWFASNVSLARKSFWTHPMELLGDMGLVESHFCPFRHSVSIGAI